MLVRVHGERRMGMSEPFGDHFDRCTGGDEQGGVGVAQVVETDARQSRPRAGPVLGGRRRAFA